MRKLRRSLQVRRQIEESREALLTDQKIFEELQGQIKAGEKKMATAEKTLLGN
jgi:septal ring factor EnvC (AmiA/AmiB activator)